MTGGKVRERRGERGGKEMGGEVGRGGKREEVMGGRSERGGEVREGWGGAVCIETPGDSRDMVKQV